MHAVLALLLAALPEEISADAQLPAGVHRLERPLRVVADGVTLDLAGVELVGAGDDVTPDRYEGIGILVEGRKGVTIRGGKVRGFRCAILVAGCEGVALEGVDVSRNFRQRLASTPEREDASDWLWPHENDEQQWRKRYGAGICLERCTDCSIVDCRARKGQNGAILDRCSGCRVLRNDLSFLSGWGLALWRSSGNEIDGNHFDWCVRGYSHGVYDRGQDSAGILVFEQCQGNRFLGNSATHGGDGFFLYAGHETTQRTGKGGCGGNLVCGNDFSHAGANAIEATFSSGNRLVGNRLDDSNYGIWAGYSFGTVIEENRLADNSVAGIAIEHGCDTRIRGNAFARNPVGIDLWWDEDEELRQGIYGRERHARSEGYEIRSNSFDACGTALRLRDTSKVVARGNRFEAVREVLGTAGTCDAIDVARESEGDAVPAAAREGARLPAGHPRGRDKIRIDEWGPLDPLERAVFPRRVVAWEECAFHVLGPDAEYGVSGLPRGLTVERGPRTFKVRGGEDGLTPFEATVTVGGERFPVSGILLRGAWKVRFWAWERDPREHPLPEGDPLKSVTLPRLDFRWGGGAPADGVPADRFATRAETTLKLPKGRYELRTVSDDGVRVRVDGKLLLENWTWHGPTEDRAEVDLAGGEHRFEVDHFEIDGWAVLALELRPVP